MAPADPKACERCGDVHDPARCRAHNRSGKQCLKPKVPGAEVCRNHGGAAPQTVAKARERLLAAAEPAAMKLVTLAKSKDEHVALRASTAILDRVGLGRDFSNGPGSMSMPATVQADLVLEFIEGVLADLAIPITDGVRTVVSARLRAMSAAQARAVQAPAPAELATAGVG